MVPPFTLSEFVAPEFGNALRADNVKSGTCVIEAPTRSEQAALYRRNFNALKIGGMCRRRGFALLIDGA